MQRFASTLALALLATLASAQDEPAPQPAEPQQEQEEPKEQAPAESDVLVVRGTLHLGDGPAISEGAVVLRAGKVDAGGACLRKRGKAAQQPIFAQTDATNGGQGPVEPFLDQARNIHERKRKRFHSLNSYT